VAVVVLALCLGSRLPADEAPWPSAPQAATLLREARTAPAGFQLSGEMRLYDRDNLRDYLGRDADGFLGYDYQWTAAAVFKHPADGLSVAVDVSGFRTDLDAFRAFSLGRDVLAAGEPVALPGQASVLSTYWVGSRLYVSRGPLYLRFLPAGVKGEVRAQVLSLAQVLLAAFPLPAQDPPLFRIPPVRGLIAESVRFQRRNVLGQEALSNALTATYGRRLPGKLLPDLELYLFDGGSSEGARRTFEALRRYLGAAQEPTPVASLGEAAFALHHPVHGQTVVMRQGRYVAMVRRVRDPSEAEALLREVARRARAGS
jgi:hypothetical protein